LNMRRALIVMQVLGSGYTKNNSTQLPSSTYP
jgi:hypothetical protein